MRVVAIIAAYNEERFIEGCIEHLVGQGVEVYLIDNASTDRTVEIAEAYLGQGVTDIETFPRTEGLYMWQAILERKEEVAASIEADWFIHQDVDEFRFAHRPGMTLAEGFAEVEESGYNAVNFIEFTFVPTREEPNHDHPEFRRTMRSYYPFMRSYPNQIKAWKNNASRRIELARGGGHKVGFDGLLLFPESFQMRHYPYLSVDHFKDKYLARKYDESELRQGWHGWRNRLVEEKIELPSASELSVLGRGGSLDASRPRFSHVAQGWAGKPEPSRAGAANEKAPEKPVIVGGCFRSGTSLVRRILDSHSRIHCGPEVKFFRDFHNDYLKDPIKHGRFVESALKTLPEEELLDELGNSFVRLQQRAAERADKPRWADKNPENVLYLDEWQRLLGDDWVFVHVVRNPLDTLASIKEIEFPRVIPPDLDGRIEVYKRYTLAGLEFAERHPERCHRVVYEELVTEPEAIISRLMAWLGEELEAEQLDFNRRERRGGLEDPKVGATKRVHSDSIGRWKEILTPEEAERISAECDPLWRKASTNPGVVSPEGILPRGGRLLRRFGEKARIRFGGGR